MECETVMGRHHVIISGTGRAGTTFLVQLCTVLGLDTGFTSPSEGLYDNCHAGMEKDLRHRDAPYIVKNPTLCDDLEEVLDRGEVVLDHAFIPMRDLYSAAESRRHVAEQTDRALYKREIPGGLWGTSTPESQEAVLTEKLYTLIYTIAEHDVPMTLLHFPRLVRDPEYLYAKLRPVLGGMEYPHFLQGFKAVARPELVNRFKRSVILSISDATRTLWTGVKAICGRRVA